MDANDWRPIADAPTLKPVLIHYLNSHGKHRIIKAVQYARFQVECGDETTDGVSEYDEGSDQFYYIAGWWEMIDNGDDFTEFKVYEGEPDTWMPLPPPPKQEAPE